LGSVLVGSRRSPACFLQGLAPPVFRWQVSYEGKSFQTKLEIWPDPKFGKCPKLVREAPRAIQKIQKKIGPKRARAQFWAQGPCTTPDPPALAGPYVLAFPPFARSVSICRILVATTLPPSLKL